MKETLFD